MGKKRKTSSYDVLNSALVKMMETEFFMLSKNRIALNEESVYPRIKVD